MVSKLRPINFCCCLSCFLFKQDSSLDIIAQVYLLWRLKKTENYCTPIHQIQSRFLIWPEPWAAEPCKEPRLSSAWIKSMGNLLHYSMENFDDNIFFFSAPSDKRDQYSMKKITWQDTRDVKKLSRDDVSVTVRRNIFLFWALLFDLNR